MGDSVGVTAAEASRQMDRAASSFSRSDRRFEVAADRLRATLDCASVEDADEVVEAFLAVWRFVRQRQGRQRRRDEAERLLKSVGKETCSVRLHASVALYLKECANDVEVIEALTGKVESAEASCAHALREATEQDLAVGTLAKVVRLAALSPTLAAAVVREEALTIREAREEAEVIVEALHARIAQLADWPNPEGDAIIADVRSSARARLAVRGAWPTSLTELRQLHRQVSDWFERAQAASRRLLDAQVSSVWDPAHRRWSAAVDVGGVSASSARKYKSGLSQMAAWGTGSDGPASGVDLSATRSFLKKGLQILAKLDE